jgi:hypothetical protein
MNQISILLDDNSRYTIDIEEKYSSEEFISTFENHILKVRKLMPISGKPESEPMSSLSAEKSINENLLKSNLFVKLDTMIENYCKNLRTEDKKAMRSFKYKKHIKGASTVTWLKPSGHNLHVLLQCRNNEDYSKIDSENKVIYDPPERGGYPYIKIKHDDEIKYAFNLIKYAYDLMESRQ